MNESEAPSNRQGGARVFNRPDLLAWKEAVCLCPCPCRCSVRVSCVEGFVDRNSFPFVVPRQGDDMHALSLVELGLCCVRPPHRFAPRGAGEKRAAGNGPAGAGAGLELSKDRQAGNWRRRGLGSKKKSGLAPRPMCPCSWGVGQAVSHCERVVWIARCTVQHSLVVWQSGSTQHKVWHCMLQAGGINWKGR